MFNLPFSAKPIFTVVFWLACAAWVLPEVAAWRAKRSSDLFTGSRSRFSQPNCGSLVVWYRDGCLDRRASASSRDAMESKRSFLDWNLFDVDGSSASLVLGGNSGGIFYVRCCGTEWASFDRSRILSLCPPSSLQRRAFEFVGVRFGPRKLGGTRSGDVLLRVRLSVSHTG
jgi:hypothetical protein